MKSFDDYIKFEVNRNTYALKEAYNYGYDKCITDLRTDIMNENIKTLKDILKWLKDREMSKSEIEYY